MDQKKKYKTSKTVKIGVIVVWTAIILFVIWNFTIQPRIEDKKEGERLCSLIQATPAWADEYGEILGYGYIESDSKSVLVNDLLIPKRIKFIYNPNCYACQDQIEYFGSEWENYVKSGLTIDCTKIK